MGLKQDIVVRNEYTMKLSSGKGSRGSSVNRYAIDYMVRPDATEVLAPVKVDGGLFDYATRYMAREDATEVVQENDQGSVLELKHRFRKIDRSSGRMFGTNSLSFSHDEMVEMADKIQEQYENGHTILKPIISFDRDYLEKTGILRPGFVYSGHGSYKGNIDQLKLRSAVTHGMNKFLKGGSFEDPLWLASIQVDTGQLHVHVLACDQEFSTKRMMPDGRDKGKMNEREKHLVRRGIHHSLMDLSKLKSYHTQVDAERTNVVSYVKNYTYDKVNQHAGLQLLIASLPKERKLWRYDSNDRRMTRSNEISEHLVKTLFEQKPRESGYDASVKALKNYVTQKRKDDDLSLKERKKLYDKGHDDIIRRSVNGLYQTLKEVDDNRLLVRTPMLDVESMSEDELKQFVVRSAEQNDTPVENDPAAFSLRVRGYKKRLDVHKNTADRYHTYIDGFDDAHERGQVNIEALIVRRFYEEELQYHMKLTDKYRYSFRYDAKRNRQEQQEMMIPYRQVNRAYQSVASRISLLEDMDNGVLYDKIGKTYDGQNGDEIGSLISDAYAVPYGSLVLDPGSRSVFRDELDEDVKKYTRSLRNYTYECFTKGVATSREWDAITMAHRDTDDVDFVNNLSYANTEIVPPFAPKTAVEGIDAYLFDEVKALDVHHLGFDFYGRSDVGISEKNAESFAHAYQWREALTTATEAYVEATGQSLDVLLSTKQDLVDMKQAVEIVAETHEVPTVDTTFVDEQIERNRASIRIDDSVINIARTIHASLEKEEIRERYIQLDLSKNDLNQLFTNTDLSELD